MNVSVSFNSVAVFKGGGAPLKYGGGTSASVLSDAPFNVALVDNKTRIEKPPRCPRSSSGYQVNRIKCRKKIAAFFHTDQAKKFMAFFSISFPNGIHIDDVYKCFNIWLTRCRKTFGDFPYVWVAEKQKNGTVHFHMLTCCRMPIREINAYMAVCLSKLSQKYGWSDDFVDRYNGVDVDNVHYSKVRKNSSKPHRRHPKHSFRYLMAYLNKYVTKSAERLPRLAWHMSRHVSALVTSERFVVESFDKLPFDCDVSDSKYFIFENEFVKVLYFVGFVDFSTHLSMTQHNQIVFDSMGVA